jgi:hypothetical protein
MNFDYANAKYSVCGRSGFNLTESLKLWKTKYPSFTHFKRDLTKSNTSNLLLDFSNFVKEVWDDIIPITIEEAFKEQNAELRRIYFDCIGVEKIFNSVNPTLLDRQVINKTRTRWDSDNKSYEYKFEDVYELYSIDAVKLFDGSDLSRFSSSDVFITAVRCWCTTTNREYWIYVPEDQCLSRGYRWDDAKDKTYDAIKAIAWTIRIGITNPVRIYRQGDVIIAEASSNSVETRPYHLSKDQYLQLMYSES